jgi:hypothetical protein
MEVEERTNYNEDEANRRFAEKQAKVEATPSEIPDRESAASFYAEETRKSESPHNSQDAAQDGGK